MPDKIQAWDGLEETEGFPGSGAPNTHSLEQGGTAVLAERATGEEETGIPVL